MNKQTRPYNDPLTGPKTEPAVTEDNREFEVVICEDCGSDIFHIGIFNGKPRYQCVKCYPTIERRTH